jgi:streptogramin lyase
MPGRRLKLFVAISAVLLGLGAQIATAAPHFDGFFPIPNIDANNAKIAAGPDGNMWLPIADGEFDVARIAPDGAVTKYKLGPEIESAKGIAAGPDGRMWITSINKIGSFDPGSPEASIDVDSAPAITSNSPVVAGPDGQMWAAASDAVVHWSTSDPGKAEPFPVPDLDPKDIDVAGSGLVVADAGNKRIVTITISGDATDVPLLEGSTTSQGVAGGANGQIAFSDSDGDEGLGLVTPPAAPTNVVVGKGDPFGVALGSDGAFYFAMAFGEETKGTVRRLTSDGKDTTLNGIPDEYVVRQIAAGPNDTLWVTMEIPGKSDVYKVARISGLELPKGPETGGGIAPDTKLKKGPRKFRTKKNGKAKVKFVFSSPNAGATFECALTRKAKKGKKAPKPKFKGCKSPKKYKLKPGSYKFSVRAVADGVADSSPATRSFKVVRARRRAVAD